MTTPPFDHDVPRLDADTVGDDELLGMAVDVVVVANVEARERMEEIFVITESLRAILDADTWQAFMAYDERANARFGELLLVVARWAFHEGQKHRLEK